MSSYEPYRPDETPDIDVTATRPADPSYETYDGAPSDPVVVQSGRSTPHRTSRPMIYGPGRSSSSGAGTAAGIVVALVAVVVVVVAGSQASSQQPAPDRYASCAAEHDEDSSLFSDEGWCDLELEGGNGNGLADEGGGSGGPVEQNSLFGDDDDPFGYP